MTRPITIEQQVSYDDGGAGGILDRVKKWTVARRAGTLPRTFSLEVAGKLPDAIQTVTIEAGMDGSDLLPVIEAAPIQVTSAEWRRGAFTTVVNGSDGADRLVQLAPAKTVIFLAKEYVDKRARGYSWRLNMSTNTIEGHGETNGHHYTWSIRMDEIPTDPDKAGTFTTVIIQNSRTEILNYLAQELGIAIENGTPETPFRGAYILDDSRSYFDAVRDLTALWNPLLAMVRTETGWTLQILDVEGGQSMIGDLTLQQHMLTVYGIQESQEDVANVATITGADKNRWQTPNGIFAPPKNLEPMELSTDYSVERVVDCDAATGTPLALSPDWKEMVRTRTLKEYATDPADPSNRVLVRETITIHGEIDVLTEDLVAKKVTSYQYVDYTAAVGQKIEEWQRVIMPGMSLADLVKIREVRTVYGDYVVEAGETERIEIEDGQVIYDVVFPPGANPQFLNPQEARIAIQNKTLDLRSASTQSYQWATIQRRQTTYEVEDPQRVRRDTIVWHNLDGTAELDTEYIPISYEQLRGAGGKPKAEWRYQDDTSIAAYGRRPRVTIGCPDLKEGEDDRLAQELWDRIKRRSGAPKIDAKVGLPIWAPVLIGQKITVQAASIKEWDPAQATFTQRTIPGGTYYITGAQDEYSLTARQAKLTTALTIRSAY